MTLPFAIIASLTIAASVAAMSLRNLVHCALALALTFSGLAALYLQLGAQFVGFAQILVYVGAVAILIVFSILLTRSSEPAPQSVFSASWFLGLFAAAVVFGVLAWTIVKSTAGRREPTQTVEASVRQIGDALMTGFILPLEGIGLLLTAALIGAVIIAMKEAPPKAKMEDGGSKMDTSSNPSSVLLPPTSRGGNS